MSFRNYCKQEKYTFARQLRKNPTQSEAYLWKYLRKKQLMGMGFRRQAIILGWIVDFYCPTTHIIIEVDGEIHNLPTHQKMDQKRDLIMYKHGFHVLRVSRMEVMQDITTVLDRILFTLSGVWGARN